MPGVEAPAKYVVDLRVFVGVLRDHEREGPGHRGLLT